MNAYNYRDAVKNDVLNYVRENYDFATELRENRDGFEEKLRDDLWTVDSVTGNGSGSYTFNAWEAEENLCHNLDLLREAGNELGDDLGYLLERGPETCDVTIRCYLLAGAISEALDELEEELPEEEEEEE